MSVGEFWPEKGVQSCEWILNYRDSAPSALSGNSIAVPLGEPYWTIDVTVEVPARSLLDSQWAGFFARREGKRNSFTANRSFRSFPASGMTPDEDAYIADFNRTTGMIQINDIGLYLAKAGDMIGYFTAQSGFYVGEIKTVNVSSPGSPLVVLATPPPFPFHPTTPSLRLIKAAGEFRMDRQPRPIEKSSRRSWSFKATQVVRG